MKNKLIVLSLLLIAPGHAAIFDTNLWQLPATNVVSAGDLLMVDSLNTDGSFTTYIITNNDFSAFIQSQFSSNVNTFTGPNTYNNCVTVNGNETVNGSFNGGGTNVLNGFGNDAQQTIILGAVGSAALDFGVNNKVDPNFSFTNRIVTIPGNFSLQDMAGNSISLSAGSFNGSGAGLTDIPDSALSANIPNLQNNNVFQGINIVPALYSDEGQVYSDGFGDLYVGQNIQGGTFHGDGQDLTNIPVAAQNLTGIFTNVVFLQTNSYGIFYTTNGGSLTVLFGLNPSVANIPTNAAANGFILTYTNTPPYCYWAPPPGSGAPQVLAVNAGVISAGAKNIAGTMGPSKNGSDLPSIQKGPAPLNAAIRIW